MIELRNVSKRFTGHYRIPGTLALDDVTLDIAAGQVCGVVGPNGAGKSTLFALLLGFLQPSRGSIRIAGLEPRDYTRAHGAGYLPERLQLPPDWPVKAGLEALAALERLDQPTARVAAALHTFGLEAHADKKMRALSRGLLQRVGLAQALLARRALIVLDEPTEGLDPLWRLRLREQIAQLRAEQRTVLLASHDLAEVERLADRVVLLANGAVRDSFAISAPPEGPLRYRITLQSPLEQVADVLGDIEVGEAGRVFTVNVGDLHELNARLAALLELGALIHSVQPAERLEQRVRDAFQDSAP
jgi:ABC-type multidrug transport system ATPase subunit